MHCIDIFFCVVSNFHPLLIQFNMFYKGQVIKGTVLVNKKVTCPLIRVSSLHFLGVASRVSWLWLCCLVENIKFYVLFIFHCSVIFAINPWSLLSHHTKHYSWFTLVIAFMFYFSDSFHCSVIPPQNTLVIAFMFYFRQ